MCACEICCWVKSSARGGGVLRRVGGACRFLKYNVLLWCCLFSSSIRFRPACSSRRPRWSVCSTQLESTESNVAVLLLQWLHSRTFKYISINININFRKNPVFQYKNEKNEKCIYKSNKKCHIIWIMSAVSASNFTTVSTTSELWKLYLTPSTSRTSCDPFKRQSAEGNLRV